MFKPVKADITHTHEFKVPDTEDLNRVTDKLVHTVKTTSEKFEHTLRQVGWVLLIGVPSVIILGFAAHVGSEILIDRFTD